MTIQAADVAAFILDQKGPMTAMKLQKLVYYGQAWSLVWDGVPLFDEPIQAWANGPVVQELFKFHKGKYKVSSSDFAHGHPTKLSEDQVETLLAVLDSYGSMSAAQLSELTHAEKPWKVARGSVDDGHKSNAVISHASMKQYYTDLSESQDAVHDLEDINFPAWAR